MVLMSPRYPGVFTPWAEVLCRACARLGKMAPRERLNDSCEAEASCDACGCDIWARDDVAALQALVKAIDGGGRADSTLPGGWHATMQQTGGMCASVYVCHEDHGDTGWHLAATGDWDASEDVTVWWVVRDEDWCAHTHMDSEFSGSPEAVAAHIAVALRAGPPHPPMVLEA